MARAPKPQQPLHAIQDMPGLTSRLISGQVRDYRIRKHRESDAWFVVLDAATYNIANPIFGFGGDPLHNSNSNANRYYGFLIRAGLYSKGPARGVETSAMNLEDIERLLRARLDAIRGPAPRAVLLHVGRS